MDEHDDLSDFSDFDIEEEFISEPGIDKSLQNDIQTFEEPHATVLSDNDNTNENNIKPSEDPEENNLLENNIEDFDNFEEYIENEQYEYNIGITDKSCEVSQELSIQTEDYKKYEEGSSSFHQSAITSSIKPLNEQEEGIHVKGNAGEKKEILNCSTVSHIHSIKQKGTKLRTRHDKNQQHVEQAKPWYYRESKWYDKEKVREFMKNKYHLVEQQSKRQKHKKEQYNEEIDTKLKKLDDWIQSQFKSKRQKIADEAISIPSHRTPSRSLNQSSSTTNARDKMKEYGAIVRERRAKLYQQSLLQKQKQEQQRLESIRKRRIRTYKSKVHFSLEGPIVRDRPSSAPSQLFHEGTKYPIIKKEDGDVLHVVYDIPSFHWEDLEINFDELDEESSISSASTERNSLTETISDSSRKNLQSLNQKTESIISEQKREVDEPKKLGNSVMNEDINSKADSKKEASATRYDRDVLEDDQKMKERSNNLTHEYLSLGREIPFRDWAQIEDEQQEDTYLTSAYEPPPTQAYESYEPCSNIDWEYDRYIMNLNNYTQSSQYPDVPLQTNLSTESDAYELISYKRDPPLFSPREFYCESFDTQLEDLSKTIRLDVKIAKKQQNSSQSNNDKFLYPSRKSVPSLSFEQSHLLSDTLKPSFDPVSGVDGISSISEATESAMLNSDSFSAFQTSGKSEDMSMNTPFLSKVFPKKVDQSKPAESNNTVKKQDEDNNSHLFLKQLIEENSDPFNIITVIALKEKKLRRERKAMKRLESTDRTLHPAEEQNLDEVTNVPSVVTKDTEHLFTKQDVQNQTDKPKTVTFNDEPNSSQADFVSGLSHRNTGHGTVINEGQDVTTKLLETIEMYKAQLEKYSLLNEKLVNNKRTRDHEYSKIPEEDLQELYSSDTSSQPDSRKQINEAENTVEPQPTSNIQLIYSPSELEHKFLAALDLFDTTQESRIQLAALEHTHAISSAHQEMVSMTQVLHRLDYKDSG